MKTQIRLRTDEPQPHIGWLISAYQDGLTSPDESDLVERHLLECETCRAFYGDLKNAYELISSLPNQAASSPEQTAAAFSNVLSKATKKRKRWRNKLKELIANSK